MQGWLSGLEELAEKGQDAVLLLAAEREGSTPGAASAKLLVTAEGRIWGTIGGGQLELHCQQRAAALLKERRCAVERLDLRPQGAGRLDMLCGGSVIVWYHYLPAGSLRAAGSGCRYLLLTQTKEGAGRAGLLRGTELPEAALKGSARGRGFLRLDPEGDSCYLERLTDPVRVHIFGGGHIARTLVPGLAKVGFGCRVYDDREEFARPERFPEAELVQRVDMERLTELCARLTGNDYVCVMTHGHRHDYAVLRQVLATPAGYIGVIGSAKKAAATADRLRAEGVSETDLDRLTTPIGLPILAETPEEIAVSILAQLIQVRAQRRGAIL